MSKTPHFNAKVKAILDETKPGDRTCSLTGEKWNMTEEEIGWYKKFHVPPSRSSPLTRIKLLLTYFTGAAWKYVPHPETGKPVLTNVHPGTGLTVLPDLEWHAKDFSSIAQRPDTASSFFSQFRSLQLQVPNSATRSYVPPEQSIALASRGDVNSYFMIACSSKNSFFGVATLDAEHSRDFASSKSIMNSHNVLHSQRLFQCQFVRESFDCLNSAFLFDCRSCEFCFGAWNKRNKKYLWWNEQLSQEEWERRRAEVDLRCRSTTDSLMKDFQNILARQAVWPENFNLNATNSLGEYLTDCIDCRYCYIGNASKNNFWCVFGYGESVDNAFCGSIPRGSNCYQSVGLYNSHGCKFCYIVNGCQSCEYCYECYDCEDCFGCVGLRKRRYCILNTQYTEDEYWPLVDALKVRMLEADEYGTFFPPAFSPIFVDECGAAIYYGVSKEALLAYGMLDLDPRAGEMTTSAIASREASDVPDCIGQVLPEEWRGIPINDPTVKRTFSLLPAEISLAKESGYYPVNKHPIRRISDLVREATIGMWQEISCAQCQKQMSAGNNIAYPQRKIFCTSCYLSFIESYG